MGCQWPWLAGMHARMPACLLTRLWPRSASRFMQPLHSKPMPQLAGVASRCREVICEDGESWDCEWARWKTLAYGRPYPIQDWVPLFFQDHQYYFEVSPRRCAPRWSCMPPTSGRPVQHCLRLASGSGPSCKSRRSGCLQVEMDNANCKHNG